MPFLHGQASIASTDRKSITLLAAVEDILYMHHDRNKTSPRIHYLVT